MRRYWAAIVVIALLSAVTAYAASYLVTPSYSSTAHVLLRIRDIRYSSATGQDQSKQQAAVVDSALIKSLAETSSNLITSQQVAEQVVRDLHLDQPRPEDPTWFGRLRAALKQAYKVGLAYVRYGYYAEPPAYDGAVQTVQGALSAQQLKDSYTIEVKALADTPDLAASIANSAARAYLARSQDRTRRESEQFRTSLKSAVEDARQQVDDATAAVREYRAAQGITDLAEQLRLSANDQDQAQKSLTDTDVQLQESLARRTAVEAAIGNVDATTDTTTSVQTQNSTTSPQTTTGTITVTTDPATSTVATGRSSTTTTSDGGTSTTRNDQTTSQRSNSNTSEDHRTTTANPVFQGLQGTWQQLNSDIAGLQARRDQLQKTRDQTVQAAGALPTEEATLRGLQLEADSATRAYQTVRASYDSALVDAQTQTPDATLIDSATPPPYPDKPWRWLFALIGLFVGALLGLAIGYGVQAWPRARTSRGAVVAVDPERPQLVLASQLQLPTFHTDA